MYVYVTYIHVYVYVCQNTPIGIGWLAVLSSAAFGCKLTCQQLADGKRIFWSLQNYRPLVR